MTTYEYELHELIEGMYEHVASTHCESQLDVLCSEAGWTRSIIHWWKKDPREAIEICKRKGFIK